jgi:hypothetical protein
MFSRFVVLKRLPQRGFTRLVSSLLFQPRLRYFTSTSLLPPIKDGTISSIVMDANGVCMNVLFGSLSPSHTPHLTFTRFTQNDSPRTCQCIGE